MDNNRYKNAKMTQSLIDILYRIVLDKTDDFNKYEEPEGLKKLKNDRDEITKILKKYGNMMSTAERKEFVAKLEMLDEAIAENSDWYYTDYTKQYHEQYDKLTLWTNVLRFSSLFFNDGQVNLLTKDVFNGAINGKFKILSTGNIDTMNSILQSNFAEYGLDANVLTNIAMAMRNPDLSKKIYQERLEELSSFIKFDPKQKKIVSAYKGITFDCNENGDLKCLLKQDLGVNISLILRNVDRSRCASEEEYQKMRQIKYEVGYETKPLEVFKYSRKRTAKFIDGKKVFIPAEKYEIEPDEIFDMFRNANAHASKQIYNPETETFTYKNEQENYIVQYDYGWLQGFSSMFLNENYCMLYGENSQYNAMPGWKKDFFRKRSLKFNNEFPLIVNDVPNNSFKSFNDVKKFLESRKYLLLTINDAINVAKVDEALDNIKMDLYFSPLGNKKDIKYSKFTITKALSKYKIKDYSLKEITEIKNREKIFDYWKKRLENLDGFYECDLKQQINIMYEIERFNKFNLENITSVENIKLNYPVINTMLEIINNSVTVDHADEELTKSNKFEIKSKNIASLQVLNQEFPVLFASFMVYLALIQTGFADIICDFNYDNKCYNRINVLDQKELEQLDFAKYVYHKTIAGKTTTIQGKNCGVDDKKDILRYLRHAVAHGRVAMVDKQEFYENPNDIKLIFSDKPSFHDGKPTNSVETTVGAIMETFSKPIFCAPTHTEIKGNAYVKH